MSRFSFEQLVKLKVLLSVEGIGPVKVKTLLSHFKKVDALLAADLNSLMHVEGISSVLAKKIIHEKKNISSIRDAFSKEYEKLDKIGGTLISLWDEEYPYLLKKIYDPPIFLYCLGNFHSDDRNSVAIVGTRNPTSYGKEVCAKISDELASQKITIVSGLARGIDTIAHSSAVKFNSRTIAVLGSGVDNIYPPENKKLASAICENGVVISEFELGTKPDAVNFPRRNRIISGLSLGSIIIETKLTGGAMQTAALALDQNREVFAIPGNIDVRQAEGTNFLIQNSQAKLITKADDIIYDLQLKIAPGKKEKKKKEVKGLSLFEEKIYSVLTDEPMNIDNIAAQSGLSIVDCNVNLLSLEFKGQVKQLPGKKFMISQN